MSFYNKKKEDVLKELNTSLRGLTSQEAHQRFDENNKNMLEKTKRTSIFAKFFKQFKDIMVIILLISAVLSIALALTQGHYDDLVEGGVILFIVFLNATLGVIQENKAENAMETLKKHTTLHAKVMRDGTIKKINSEDLVVGDIIYIENGDIVPADIRLLESTSLKVDESSLTGESVSEEKNAELVLKGDIPLSERKNMAYSGTIVTFGKGIGVVTTIGVSTEMGKIAKLLNNSKKELTPLQKSLNKIGKLISCLVLIIAGVIFLAELIFAKTSFIDAFLTAIALSVAAIPESLPAVVTIIMALGVQKLADKKAIIKRLHAVETLGSCEVICTDKTGTLTLNQMTVTNMFVNQTTYSDFAKINCSNIHVKEMLNCMILCNDAQLTNEGVVGEPTEKSLFEFANRLKVDINDTLNSFIAIQEIPFDSTRKMMSVVAKNKISGKIKCYTKGAIDVVLNKCKHIYVNGRIEKLDSIFCEKIEKKNKEFTDNSLRVLAFAMKNINPYENGNYENDLVFLGLVGIVDPPRPEVKNAIKSCFVAGLKPIMITGDHKNTAFNIAKELGICKSEREVLTGQEIDRLGDKLNKEINNYSVFARVTPEHKVKIVKAFKALDKIVAMTGDGVNDAPSLKIADIGVGMGIMGTEVTKDVADMIIADDNFATIVVAVKEGRKIYSNIQKTIQFLLSTNAVEVVTIFLSCLLFPQLVFLVPSQILFINFITDSLPAIALGVEPAEKDIMEKPPNKKRTSILSKTVCFKICYQAFLQIVISMFIFILGNKLYGNEIATTMVFFTINIMQVLHSFNLKTSHSLLSINIFSNKMFNFSFIFSFCLIALVAFVPLLQTMFSVVPLNLTQWLLVLLFSFAIIPLVELGKWLISKFSYERIK